MTGKKARQREAKWLKMLEHWDEWIGLGKKKPKVPPCLTHVVNVSVVCAVSEHKWYHVQYRACFHDLCFV